MSFKRVGITLIAVGVLSVFNASIATMRSAERSYAYKDYINTHWITTIILFAGLAHFVRKEGEFYGEVFSFTTSLACTAVCFSSIIADIWNLLSLRSTSIPTSIRTAKPEHMVAYGAIDAVLSLFGLFLSVAAMKSLLKSSHHHSNQSPNVPIFGLGTALVVLAVTRAFFYLLDLYTMEIEEVLFFRNYTLDEPAWICISIATGAICILSYRGSNLLRGVSLAAVSTLIWPAMFYMWLDYRVLSNLHTSNGFLRTLSSITIGLTLAELGTLVAILLVLLSQLPPYSRLRFDNSIRLVFLCFSALFLFLSVATLVLEMYVIARQAFYRIFHGTEQKTGLISGLLAVFSVLSANPGLASTTMPIAMAISLLAANSTIFQLWTYLYLTYKGYFADTICSNFLLGEPCNDPITKEGVRLHFLEALINFAVFCGSAFFCAFLMRISRMNKVEPSLSENEKTSCRKTENYLRAIGVAMAVGALFLLSIIKLKHVADSPISHPLVTIYGYIYHFTSAVPLVVFPLYQILVAENLRTYPLQITTLLCMSAARFVSILTHLDFRLMGESLSFDWQVHHAVDFFAMFCHFLSILLVLRLQSIGDKSTNPIELPFDFENPLSGENQDNGGYLQLRTEEQI